MTFDDYYAIMQTILRTRRRGFYRLVDTPPTNDARSPSRATCTRPGFDDIMPKTLATATVDSRLGCTPVPSGPPRRRAHARDRAFRGRSR